MGDRDRGPRLVSSAKPASPTRLQSWKEIAAYLRRDERTVRRWEKSEGLPVHRLQHGKSGSVFAESAELDAWTERRTDGLQKRSPAGPAVPGWLRRGVFLGVAAVALAAAVWVGLSLGVRRASVATAMPLTSDPGTELEPSLSPDGTQVAYVWDGERHDNFDIYAGVLTGGPPRRLTRDPAQDHSPAWSPDGASIAFLRQTGAEQAAVFVVPARGGTERLLSESAAPGWIRWPGRLLAWSPDGKWLVAVGRHGPGHINALFRIAIATGERRLVIPPPPGSLGDTGPAVSPDGKTLAFSRRLSWGVSELCLLPLSPDLMPAGEVRRLKTGSTWNTTPAWMPDGNALLFSTGAMDGPHLARIAVSNSAREERLPGLGDYGFQPSLARTPDGRVRLVYTKHFESVNLWRQPLEGAGPAVELIASAHWSFEPDYSPDGKRIAFLSDRSGNPEVWVADADGNKPRQWTFLGQPSLGGPRWCPQSRRIAFTVPGPDGSAIHLVEQPGRAPRLVPGSHRCGYLTWSPDGRALYFTSNRGGNTQIWRIAPEGGEAVQVTTRGGRIPAVSADGRYLYYLRLLSTAGDQQLFRVSLVGGDEEKVLDFVDAYSLGSQGIAFKYYRPGAKPEGPYLRLLRFATGQVEELPKLAKPLRYGIAISPDGRHVLYSQADYAVSDLMLVDGLR